MEITHNDDGGTGLNSRIAYMPTVSGTYYLGAKSYSYSTGTYTLSVSGMADDAGNDTNTRATIADGGLVMGSLEQAGDLDFYRITLTAGTQYTFDLEGSRTNAGTLVDPFLDLYNGSGAWVAYNDDGGEGLNSRIVYTPTTTGTYFLAARDFGNDETGTYTLRVRGAVIPDDAGNGTSTTATIAVPGSVTGALEQAGDRDWYRVDLRADTDYTFTLEGSTTQPVTLGDPYLYLYDSAGTELSRNDDGAGSLNSRIAFRPASDGTYYIAAGEFGDNGTGTYRLTASGMRRTDDYGNDTTTTGVLAVSGTTTTALVTGSLEQAGDVDWFRIDMTAGGTYVFDLEGAPTTAGTLTDPFLYLYGATGGELARDDDSGVGANARLEFHPTASGTYYVAARAFSSSATGTYRLTATAINDDYGNDTSTAGTLSSGASVTGNLERAGDQDWFAVRLTAGTRYTFDLEGASTNAGTLYDPYFYLHDSTGAEVAHNDDGGVSHNARLVYTPTVSGTYYAVARDYGDNNTGSYRLSLNNASLPVLSVSAPEVNEGNSGTRSMVFTVTLAWPAIADVTANYQVTGVTATAGSDFQAASGTLTIAAGRTIGQIAVTVLGDTTVEPDETLMLTLSNITGATAAGGATTLTATGTIKNDDTNTDDYGNDTSTLGRVTVGQSVTGSLERPGDSDWFGVAMTAGTQYTIDLEGAVTGQGTLADPYLYVYNPSGTLTGSSDDDGTGVNARLVFTAQSTGTHYVAARAFGDNNIGTYRVSVAEARTLPTLTINNVQVNEGNSGKTNAVFTVTLSAASTAPVTVDYATSDRGGTAGNVPAGAGRGFTPTNGTLTIAAGQTTGSITVEVLGDTLVEPNQDFAVVLSNPQGAVFANAAARISGTGTIVDDDRDDFAGDRTTTGTVTVGGSVTGSLETAGDADWFAVQLQSGTPYTIDLAARNNNNGLGALRDPYLYLHGTDGTLIASNDDGGGGTNSRLSHTPTVSGTYYVSARSFGDNQTGGYQINLSASQPQPVISVYETRVVEGNSGTANLVFTVNLSFAAPSAVRVAYAVLPGSAAANTDYTPVSGTLTIAAGARTGTVTVPVIGDRTVESNETLTLELSNPQGAVFQGGATTLAALGTIVNDDATVDDYAGGTGTTGRLTVGSSVTGIIETVGDDDWFAVTLAAGGSYRFAVAGATTGGYEPLRDTHLYLRDASGALLANNDDSGGSLSSAIDYTARTSGTYYLSVREHGDDAQGGYRLSATQQVLPTLSISNPTVTEGNSGTTPMTFTVSLSTRSTQTVTVNYATGSGVGVATPGTDFQAASGTLTFAPGETAKPVTVNVIGDTTVESSETVPLILSNPSGATLPTNPTQGLGTIRDDDASTGITMVSRVDAIGRTGWIPPDPSGAVSANHLVNVVNSSIEWYSRSSGTQLSSRTLNDFFSPLQPQTGLFDPKVIYDQYSNRFVVVALEKGSNSSRIVLAVSDTADPTGKWNYMEVNSRVVVNGTAAWTDYPGIGVDEQAVYITGNLFGFSSGYQGSRLWIIPKGETGGWYAGRPGTSTMYDVGTLTGTHNESTIQPAHMYGDASQVGMYLTSYNGYRDGAGNEMVTVYRVDNPLGNPTFTAQNVSVGNIDDASFTVPNRPQRGTTTTINAGDGRMLDTAWRNGQLYAVTTVVPDSGPDAGQATAHWFQFDTASNTSYRLVQQGNVGGEELGTGTATADASIAVAADGSLGISFAASGPQLYSGAYFTGRRPTDPLGTTLTPVAVAAGQGPYIAVDGSGRNRWGDYTGTALDPVDGQTFWSYNEFALANPNATSGSTWDTAYAQFRLPTALGNAAAMADRVEQTQAIVADSTDTQYGPVSLAAGDAQGVFLVGTNGGDSLQGTDGADTLVGYGGADTLIGGGGADTLEDGPGNDAASGEGGDDLFIDGEGADTIDGGAGQDVLRFASGTAGVIVDLAAGSAKDSFGYNDSISAIEVVEGTSMDDRLSGDLQDNGFIGGLGDDTIDGRDGSDWAAYDGLRDSFGVAFEGSQTLVLDLGGVTGIDSIANIEKLFFNDRVVDLQALDTAASADGDLLRLTDAAETVDGGNGNDQISGLGGNDRLIGGNGNDLLDGGTDDDTLEGGTGDDAYVVDSAGDQVVEAAGSGIDTVFSVVSYTLGSDVERLVLMPSAGSINGIGNALDNRIVGNGGDNTILAQDGTDTLVGGAGNDTLDGGAGTDTLVLSSVPWSVVLNDGAWRITGADGVDTVRNVELVQIGTLAPIAIEQLLSAPTLFLSAAAAAKAEGNAGTTAFTFTVARLGDASGTASADWAVTGSGTNPANAADFGGTLPSGTVSFAAGETSRTITVAVAGDSAVEPDESFIVTLSAPTGATLGTATAAGTIRNDDAAAAIDPTRHLSITSGGVSRDVQMDAYSGPVVGLRNQFIGSDSSEAAHGSDNADFIHLLGGDDAVDGGAGDDVLDGGLGSNFLTGGSGTDTFFVDGRSGGITWSTITDLDRGEWATAWGWREGTSKLTWAEMSGADGFKGATAHIDLDANGSIDMSMTITGKSSGAILATTGSSGGSSYLAFTLS